MSAHTTKSISFQIIKRTFPGIALLITTLQLPAQKKPNVIYILTDQWRSTAFGFAGNQQVKTPNIDSFAKQAVVFKNCVSVCPICTPYRAALMTGRYPTSTGMFMNDLYLPEKEECMAEIFKKAGYSTAYYGKWHLDGHGRFNNVEPDRRQGFDYWKASECSHDYNRMLFYENDDPNVKYWNHYSPFAIEEDAEKYLESVSRNKNPFLVFLSFATPHFSTDQAPAIYQEMYRAEKLGLPKNVTIDNFPNLRKELQHYYAHCTATDEAIGRLMKKIKALGLFDSSIIIFTSDHGEMMGSHGVRPREKQVAWDEAVKVPFLIRFPGIGLNEGKQTSTPVTTPDILPTMLALAHIRIPSSIEGNNISAAVKNPTKETMRAVLFMSVYPTAQTQFSEYRGIKTNRYTYVKTPKEAIMLFDNVSDPYEMDNLIDNPQYEGLKGKMDRLLKQQLRRIGDDHFRNSRFYLEIFGFHDIAEKGGVIPYSEEWGKIVQVYTPKKEAITK